MYSDICEDFDSGLYNDIVKAYCEIAAQQTGLTENQVDKLTDKLRELLDTMTAADILKAAGYAVNE